MPGRPYTMDRDTLQELMYLQIATTEGKAYERLCSILLPLMGVLGPDGEPTPAYANSPMWTITEDNVITPSVIADLATRLLGDDLSQENIARVLESLGVADEEQATALRAWLTTLGATAKAKR